MFSLHACYARLRRLLRRQGRSREDAEDLIQDALLRLHVYEQTAEVRNHEAFLVEAVQRLSIDRHRRERRHLYAQVSIEDLGETLPLIDPSPVPHEAWATEERLRLVGRTLEKLSPRTRDIYFGHRLGGFSYAEIAARERISESTVEKHIARAVLALMSLKDFE